MEILDALLHENILIAKDFYIFLDKPNQKHIFKFPVDFDSNFGTIRSSKQISFLYSFNCLSYTYPFHRHSMH